MVKRKLGRPLPTPNPADARMTPELEANAVHVLIVEDEADLAHTLARGLRRQGHVVDVRGAGDDALSFLEDAEPDVVILDRDLPGVHGDTVCRTLVSTGHPARILMLTASGTLEDVVTGLGIGADDYLAKPFSYLELLARIEALGRRSPSRTGNVGSMLEYGCLRVDTRRQTAECNGLPLSLTPKEYGVITELIKAGGAFRTAMQLLDAVWDDPFDRTTDVVKVTIHSLRAKLDTRDRIQTVVGFGYRLT